MAVWGRQTVRVDKSLQIRDLAVIEHPTSGGARLLQVWIFGPTPMNDNMLSVLIRAFNEEPTIIPVLRRVLALGSLLKEIIVIDDGSRDRTPELVEDFAADHPLIRFHRLSKNSGKTAAIQRALDIATGDIIMEVEITAGTAAPA